MCCVQVESTCQVTISKEDAKFTGNEGIQTKKRITLPNVISTLNDSKLYIAVANWSNTPEKLYANTVMGTVEKLYDNPDIAVITDHTIPESDGNAPVGNAEAQFDTIAQAPESREETKDTTWYDDIKWDEMNLTTGQKVALLVLLIQFMAIFAMNPTDIGLTRLLKHDIDIGNAKPIWQPQYRIPHAYRSLVAQQMDRLKAAGVITESHSPWNSPSFSLVVVRKKTPDNSIQIRCCLDLRGVNKLISVTPYQMPRIDDILDQLSNAKYISVLDLKDAYNAIELTERSKDITSFHVPSIGKFKYNRLPFGLASAGFAFQELIELALNTSRSPWVCSYLDDIIVFSDTFEEHLDQHIVLNTDLV